VRRRRDRAQPGEQALLALAVAERARARELGLDDVLDDGQALGDQRDDLAIDRFDAIAEGGELDGRHTARLYLLCSQRMTDRRDKAELAEAPPAELAHDAEPPVVARMIIEIRSDGSRTIARGALEDTASGQRTAIEARGDSPLQLALALARSLTQLPRLTARAA